MINADLGTEKWNNRMTEQHSSPGETIDEVTSQVREKVSQFGRTVVQKLDEGRHNTADALQSTAQTLRSGAQSSTEAISNVANRTAETMESTAKYVRDKDFGSLMKDLRQVVRRNPAPALFAAVAVGFLMGSAFRGRNLA